MYRHHERTGCTHPRASRRPHVAALSSANTALSSRQQLPRRSRAYTRDTLIHSHGELWLLEWSGPPFLPGVPGFIMRSITNFLFTAFSNLRNGAEKLNRSDANKNSVKNRETTSVNDAPAPQPKASTSKFVIKGEPPVTSGADTRASRSTTRLKVSTHPEAVAQPPGRQEESRQFNRAQTQARNEVGELILLMRKRVADDDSYKEKSAELFAKALEKYGNTSEIWDSDLFAVLITMRHWNLAKIALDHGAGTYFKDHAPTVADSVTKRLQAEIDTIKKELAEHISNPLGLVKARSHTRKGEDALRVLRRNRAQWKVWVAEHIEQSAPPASSGSAIAASKNLPEARPLPREPHHLHDQLANNRSTFQAKTGEADPRKSAEKTLIKSASNGQSSNAKPLHTDSLVKPNAQTKPSDNLLPPRQQFLNKERVALVLRMSADANKVPAFQEEARPFVLTGTRLPTQAEVAKLRHAAELQALNHGPLPSPEKKLLRAFLRDHGQCLIQGLVREYTDMVAQRGVITASGVPDMFADSAAVKEFGLAWKKTWRESLSTLSTSAAACIPSGLQTYVETFKDCLIAEIQSRESERAHRLRNLAVDYQVELPETFAERRPAWLPPVVPARPPRSDHGDPSNTNPKPGTDFEQHNEKSADALELELVRELCRDLFPKFTAAAQESIYEPLNAIRADLEYYFNVLIPTAVARIPLLKGELLTEAQLGYTLEVSLGSLSGKYVDQRIRQKLNLPTVAASEQLERIVTAGIQAAESAKQQQRDIKNHRNLENKPYPLGDVVSESVLRIIKEHLNNVAKESSAQIDPALRDRIGPVLLQKGIDPDAYIERIQVGMTRRLNDLIELRNIMEKTRNDTDHPLGEARRKLHEAARTFLQSIIKKGAVTHENRAAMNRAIHAYCRISQTFLDKLMRNQYKGIRNDCYIETPDIVDTSSPY